RRSACPSPWPRRRGRLGRSRTVAVGPALREAHAMMDKNEFEAKLAECIGQQKVQAVRTLEPGMVMVCTLAKDFDPKTNELWDFWGNRSAVRDDVRCCGCCEPLAVSNWAYEQYKAMPGEKARPYCMACATEVIEQEAAE